MNKFMILNWYHYDLNYKIINFLKEKKQNKSKIKNKNYVKNRMELDFRLKIKND